MEGIKALEWEMSRRKLSLICKAGEKKKCVCRPHWKKGNILGME